MDIREHRAADLVDLVRLVNAQMKLVPPGWAVGQEVVAAMLESDPWRAHYPEDIPAARPKIVVAEGGGRLAAAVGWYRSDPAEEAHDGEHRGQCYLPLLLADPVSGAGLGPLLAEVARRARDEGCGFAHVLLRNPLGLGWFGMPEAWPGAIAALTGEGFEKSEPWVIMTGSIGAALRAGRELPAGVELRWREQAVPVEWDVEALAGGKWIGECNGWDLPDHLRAVPGAKMWTTIEYVGVEDETWLRRGIGRALLLEQLRRQRERGVENVMLWTEPDNEPMLKLAGSLGFARGPTCWRLRKRLA